MLLCLELPSPGGGMADAEDLKSSGDFSSCGFDSHPGHQFFPLKLDELLDRRLPCTSDVPHLEKVRVGPDPTHAPSRLPVVPVSTVPTAAKLRRGNTWDGARCRICFYNNTARTAVNVALL